MDSKPACASSDPCAFVNPCDSRVGATLQHNPCNPQEKAKRQSASKQAPSQALQCNPCDPQRQGVLQSTLSTGAQSFTRKKPKLQWAQQKTLPQADPLEGDISHSNPCNPRAGETLQCNPCDPCMQGDVQSSRGPGARNVARKKPKVQPVDQEYSSLGNDEIINRAVAVCQHTNTVGSIRSRSYMDSFNNKLQPIQPCGTARRVLPRNISFEINEVLPVDAAMGHHMMTVADADIQYYWCEKCSAYTGMRAQKLTQTCDNITRKSQVVDRLRRGEHPGTGLAMATVPRRLTN